ncbi:hypothetical protein [Clostridium hydrogenum]|uniref:hypothetical protein n=1 Tax=Clostridium hydrogenum TaxID=2855764 RepID=UPI001F20E8CC|nr:hypothetical protein [Clostridium hydrogenum]
MIILFIYIFIIPLVIGIIKVKNHFIKAILVGLLVLFITISLSQLLSNGSIKNSYLNSIVISLICLSAIVASSTVLIIHEIKKK